jgi:transposase-like protein
MNTPVLTDRYKNHRFPAEIISHAVWLYFRFCLSYRDVEELLFARGVTVSYEAIRKWCRKFGQQYANQLRYRRPRPGDKWHLDGERRMQRFKSPGHAQRFLAAYGPITQYFRPRRHLLSPPEYRREMGKRFPTWQALTSVPTAA